MTLPLFPTHKIRRRRKPRLPDGAVRICLHDEAPHIGSGWRIVEVLSSGPKWTRLRDCSTDARVRLPRATWVLISKRARPL